MKNKSVVLLALSLMAFSAAYSQEVDDMYFTSKDRSKLVEARPAAQNVAAPLAEEPELTPAETVLTPSEGYSARGENPDFITASNTKGDVQYFASNYQPIGVNQGLTTTTGYNNFNNSAYGSGYGAYGYPYNSMGMGGNPYYGSMGMGYPYMGSMGYGSMYGMGYSSMYGMGMGYGSMYGMGYGSMYGMGMGYGSMYGMGYGSMYGMGMGYGMGYPYYGSMYGMGYYGGGYGYPTYVVAGGDYGSSRAMGVRGSRTSSLNTQFANHSAGTTAAHTGRVTSFGNRTASSSQNFNSGYYQHGWKNTVVNTTGSNGSSGRSSSWSNSNTGNSRSSSGSAWGGSRSNWSSGNGSSGFSGGTRSSGGFSGGSSGFSGGSRSGGGGFSGGGGGGGHSGGGRGR